MYSHLKTYISGMLTYSSVPVQKFLETTSPFRVHQVFKKHFSYSPIAKKAIRRSYARPDKFFLARVPPILDLHSGTVDLARAYSVETESRPDPTPYSQLGYVIHELFSDLEPDSILDVGCSNGWLVADLSRKFSGSQVVGLEIRQEHVDWARETHKQEFIVADFTSADALVDVPKADLLICMEVGEHLLPSRIDAFMSNLVSAAKGYALISWSRSFPPPDAPPQHIGPLYRKEMDRLFKAWGFEKDTSKTRTLRKLLGARPGVHYWWNESATVYKSPRALSAK
jgi:2-polyprenyl-3-methyl-5-hydroxy-6-metoxy-1,4-benzoquinol methylase